MIDPSLLAYAEGTGLTNYVVSQGRYEKLVLLWSRRLLEHYKSKLVSIILYGSVARGKASRNSDIDFMIILQDRVESYGKRINELVRIEMEDSEIGREKNFLTQHGCGTSSSNIVYSVEESRVFRLIYLDIIEEGRILFDRNNHFRNLCEHYRESLRELGARKVVMDSERWYWELKPDIRFGERVVIG
jgi:predicted nucleotidyltransferase